MQRSRKPSPARRSEAWRNTATRARLASCLRTRTSRFCRIKRSWSRTTNWMLSKSNTLVTSIVLKCTRMSYRKWEASSRTSLNLATEDHQLPLTHSSLPWPRQSGAPPTGTSTTQNYPRTRHSIGKTTRRRHLSPNGQTLIFIMGCSLTHQSLVFD